MSSQEIKDITEKYEKKNATEDFADRLNRKTTVYMLVGFFVFSLAITSQWFGTPITCWVPAEFSGAWAGYVNDYCYIESTYFVNVNESLNKIRKSPTGPPIIRYYQWVPYMLMLQAILFFVPYGIWRLLIMYFEFSTKRIVFPEVNRKSIQDENKKVDDAAVGLDFILTETTLYNGYGPRQGYQLVLAYLTAKCLYVLNVVAQLFMIADFLDVSRWFWGVQFLNGLFNGRPWQSTGHFPRITFCDFQIVTIGDTMKRTVQCVLPVNMLTEKIYIFVWFWYMALLVVNVGTLIYWTYTLLFRSKRRAYLKHLLEWGGRMSTGETSRLVNDTDKFEQLMRELKPDGVFLCRLFAMQKGEKFAYEMLEKTLKTRLNFES